MSGLPEFDPIEQARLVWPALSHADTLLRYERALDTIQSLKTEITRYRDELERAASRFEAIADRARHSNDRISNVIDAPWAIAEDAAKYAAGIRQALVSQSDPSTAS